MILIRKGVTNMATPVLIIPMSLRPVIPWRVALQHCSPPLHRPPGIMIREHDPGKPGLLPGSNSAPCDLTFT